MLAPAALRRSVSSAMQHDLQADTRVAKSAVVVEIGPGRGVVSCSRYSRTRAGRLPVPAHGRQGAAVEREVLDVVAGAGRAADQGVDERAHEK